jgi:hypothetical protein
MYWYLDIAGSEEPSGICLMQLRNVDKNDIGFPYFVFLSTSIVWKCAIDSDLHR